MKFTLVIIMVMLFSSCSSNLYKRERFTYAPKERQIWIDSYKYEVFYGCIKEGIQNDSLRIILKPRDLFSKNTNVDFQNIDKARKYGQKVINEMPKANIKIDKGEEYLRNKNFISYDCLVYYASLELDSIANIAYKEYLKKAQ